MITYVSETLWVWKLLRFWFVRCRWKGANHQNMNEYDNMIVSRSWCAQIYSVARVPRQISPFRHHLSDAWSVQSLLASYFRSFSWCICQATVETRALDDITPFSNINLIVSHTNGFETWNLALRCLYTDYTAKMDQNGHLWQHAEWGKNCLSFEEPCGFSASLRKSSSFCSCMAVVSDAYHVMRRCMVSVQKLSCFTDLGPKDQGNVQKETV